MDLDNFVTPISIFLNLEGDPAVDHRNAINDFLFSMLNNGEIDFSVYDYLYNKECRTPILYLLSKIHKGITPPLCRPIVSAVNLHTEKISYIVHHFLNPCATRVDKFVAHYTCNSSCYAYMDKSRHILGVVRGP